jgi:hypothetical protein
MVSLAGPVAVAALVLAVGGFYKLRDPAPTATMFATLGLPSSPGLVRGVGVVEIAAGTATFLVGGPVATGGVAALFAGFTLITLRLVRLGDAAASCGCFGRLSSRPSFVHVGVDAAAAVVAAIGALTGTPGFLELRSDLPAAGVPQLLLVALGAWLVVVTLTVLPDTLAAARRGPRQPSVRPFEITSELR